MFVWQKKEAQRYNAYRHTPPKQILFQKQSQKAKAIEAQTHNNLKSQSLFLL
jgi:hypothetical protein